MIDAHVRKMPTECSQMLCSAVIRHGAKPEEMPLTKSGSPTKGGYKNHPCTIWAGDSSENFKWLNKHAYSLGVEFRYRFGKEHYCTSQLATLAVLGSLYIPKGPFTEPPQCMPEKYHKASTVKAYISYYENEKMFDKNGKNMWNFTKRNDSKEWWEL